MGIGNESGRGHRSYWQIAAVAVAGMISLAAAGCSHHHHHDHNDVAVSAGYQYYYYPQEEVYYDPGVRVYYWHDRDHWRHGPTPPRYYHLEPDRRVQVRVNSRHPYEMHAQVRAAHPPTPHGPPMTPPGHMSAPGYGPGGR